MTPDQLSGLVGWFDSRHDHVLFNDMMPECASADDYLAYVVDRARGFPTIWGTDYDGVDNIAGMTASRHPQYLDGVRFYFDDWEFAYPVRIQGEHTDYLYTQDFVHWDPDPDFPPCGERKLSTTRFLNWNNRACWTFFLVLKTDSYDAPYPLWQPANPTILPVYIQSAGWEGIVANSWPLDFGIKIIYNENQQIPKYATVQEGILGVVGSTIDLGQVVILEASCAGVSTNVIQHCLWKNGQLLGTNTFASSTAGGFSYPLYLGLAQTLHKGNPPLPGWGRELDTHMYEALAFSRLLSNYERDEMRAYLASRWGVTAELHSTSDCENCGAGPFSGVALRRQATLIGAN